MKGCPLIVSYYTKNSSYEQEALFLKCSCEKLHLNYHIEGIPSRGSWSENCCFKPTFLKEQLLKHKRDLLWVDCDAILVKPPYIFSNAVEDIGFKYIEEASSDHPSKVMTGTLFLKYTPKVIELLEKWEAGCKQALKEDESAWDQTVLRDLFSQKKGDYSLLKLPKSYCQVYDKIQSREELQASVIIHFQASRLTKYEGQISALFTHLQLGMKQEYVNAIFKALEC